MTKHINSVNTNNTQSSLKQSRNSTITTSSTQKSESKSILPPYPQLMNAQQNDASPQPSIALRPFPQYVSFTYKIIKICHNPKIGINKNWQIMGIIKICQYIFIISKKYVSFQFYRFIVPHVTCKFLQKSNMYLACSLVLWSLFLSFSGTLLKNYFTFCLFFLVLYFFYLKTT